jgi:protein-tyrosine-phosphatase
VSRPTLIFVCTGNTCRSPLAEGLARKLAAERGLDVDIVSAGTAAALGAPANDAAILVGIERGVDLSRHRSRPLLPGEIPPGAIVLTMSPSHAAGARALAPGARVYLLDEYASNGITSRTIADPFGGTLEDYRRAADEIESMLDGVLDRLAAERNADRS